MKTFKLLVLVNNKWLTIIKKCSYRDIQQAATEFTQFKIVEETGQ